MGALARVTVTLPEETVRTIDSIADNRSKFILDAVQHELRRRRRAEFRRSLAAPHPETAKLAETGVNAWAKSLPADDISELVDLDAATAIHWVAERGWRYGAPAHWKAK